ncbi:hypothetical protein [Marinobacterium litorale]|uniref:hypothetical protein n=1 Tax=Marinobacterium litorale TaxID=404770 RepID=UPI0003FBC81D|nr:hypothetical protein [Marinobacterium litorale]
MNNDYFIINLPATRKAGEMIFWAVVPRHDTKDQDSAMIVSEEHLNKALHRYDNGATTRAILAQVVREHDGDLMELLTPKKPATEEGEAA